MYFLSEGKYFNHGGDTFRNVAFDVGLEFTGNVTGKWVSALLKMTVK